MKGEVAALIKELEDACRRPLFTAIKSGPSSDGPKTNLGSTTPITETASFSNDPDSESGSNVSISKVAASSSSAYKRSHVDSIPHRSWQEVSLTTYSWLGRIPAPADTTFVFATPLSRV
jgi:hypothetical protein